MFSSTYFIYLINMMWQRTAS